ncbi:F-box/LRR-repeat protein 6 [Folsomia candida]|uniref:F-box/LRR-repeat protein 6 n=1 Tax=Folsomia candida TaxID=158441 RepID=UPI000B9060F0|nr:F-box/LRR-repeat protein 6 [Folsomia candida]
MMNGFYDFQTTAEQLLADSSGMMMNMSDSEFGSSDSSSLGISHSHPRIAPNLMLNGGGGSQFMMMGTTVQNQTYITQQNPGAHHYNNNSSSGHHHHQGSTIKPMVMRSGGKPAAMAQAQQACTMNNESSSRHKHTDHFLSQFQEQMSQMKSAMDAVQNEILFHSSSPATHQLSPHTPSSPLMVGAAGGKPMAAAAMAMTSFSPSPPAKRGPGRPRGSGAAQSTKSVRYQSQISALNGLKIRIKKSPGQLKRKGYKGKGKRKKRKGNDDEDDDDDNSDEEEEYRRPSVQKSTKMSHATTNLLSGDGNATTTTSQSGWGDSLPEHVLSKIFSYAVKCEGGAIPVLVRASKVSRLWWKTASKPDLWTLVDLSSPRVKDKFKIERNLVYFLEHRFPRVKHLNLAGGWPLTNLSIDVLIRSCKELENIGLNGCQKLTAQHLKTITESCLSLKKIDLSAISTTYNTKTAVSPAAIADCAETMGERLMHLSLANNCLANCPQIVASLAEFCPNLQVLDLSNVTSPRRDTIVINIEHLQQGCQRLKILRLTNSDFVLSETSLKEQVSSPGFKNLEELSIAVDPKRCVGMDEGDLERILKQANKLKLLDVRGCSRIGDSGLVRISAWELEHLYLSGCYATRSSNDGLELVSRKWRHSFKEIDFSWTPGEETINCAVRALAEADDDVPPLRVLDLCGSSVSFDSVKLALKTCIHLEKLNLTSCRALPRGIKRNYQIPDEVVTLREQVLSGKYDDHPDD